MGILRQDLSNRIELHLLKDDRAESVDLAKEHPDIVARLTKLVLDWNATLPKEPDPTCISTTDRINLSSKSNPPNAAATNALAMSAVNLAKAFNRMDTNKDGVLTFEEYIKGMKNSPGTASEFEQRFKRFDKDGNGTMTREEFTIR